MSTKPRNRSVLSTRRRAMRKQAASNQTQRNSTYRMSLLKECEAESENKSKVLWPL